MAPPVPQLQAKSHSFVVDGVTFTTTAVNYETALSLLSWLTQSSAPMFAATQSGSPELVVASIEKTIRALRTDELDRLVKAFSGVTRFVNPENSMNYSVQQGLNTYFSANWGALLEVVVECSRFNFQGFFSRAMAKLNEASAIVTALQ